MDRIIQILQKEYDRVEYAMKLGRSIGKENAPEFKQLEKELKETDNAIKILATNADTGEKQCNLPVVSGSASDFYTDLMKVINAYCKQGLRKPDLVHKMEYATESCKLS